MTWKLNHCPDSVLWSSVSCQSLEEGSRSCNLERARGHWHGDNQNYFTTQLQMLVTNIFTSLTAPSTQIRTHVSPAVSRWGSAESGLFWTLVVSPPGSEGEDCDEKSRKLQVKRVKAGLDTGVWAPTQGPRTAGQYSDSGWGEWAVTLGQSRPGLRAETGPRAPITKCFVGFGNSIPRPVTCRDLTENTGWGRKFISAHFKCFNHRVLSHFFLFFSASLPALRDESE